MSSPRKQLRLGAFIPATGHHVAAWRHPDAQADGGHSFKHYLRVAQAAEAARFDAVFLADSAAVWGGASDLASLSRSARAAAFEPITLLSALSSVTEQLGLIATVTTTYNEPFHLARKFASLDHLSGGRAGWNLVTSANQAEAQNFGLDAHVEHARRYERAEEFIDVVTGCADRSTWRARRRVTRFACRRARRSRGQPRSKVRPTSSTGSATSRRTRANSSSVGKGLDVLRDASLARVATGPRRR
ncbi:LLM class flavin-dependent oxidoreductase [Sorangium sp. So ce260]